MSAIRMQTLFPHPHPHPHLFATSLFWTTVALCCRPMINTRRAVINWHIRSNDFTSCKAITSFSCSKMGRWTEAVPASRRWNRSRLSLWPGRSRSVWLSSTVSRSWPSSSGFYRVISILAALPLHLRPATSGTWNSSDVVSELDRLDCACLFE